MSKLAIKENKPSKVITEMKFQGDNLISSQKSLKNEKFSRKSDKSTMGVKSFKSLLNRNNTRFSKPWSKQEDIKLLELVEIYGTGNWEFIAGLLKTRDSREVEMRFREKLDPIIVRSKFSPEEDALILKLRKEYGNKWSEIAKILKTRTPMMIKNRFYTKLRKGIKKDSNNSVANYESDAKTVITDKESIIPINNFDVESYEKIPLYENLFRKLYIFYSQINKEFDFSFLNCLKQNFQNFLLLDRELDRRVSLLCHEFFINKNSIENLLNTNFFLINQVNILLDLVKITRTKLKLALQLKKLIS